MDAVNAGALYYLLKPIELKELQQAVRKVVEYFEGKKQELLSDTRKPQRITLTHTGGFSVIEMKDIVRLQADNNYTHVHTINKKAYLVSKPLKVFEDNLKDINFFRVHRSYIINLYHVKEYLREDGGTILLTDDTKIQLPKTRHADFLEAVRKLSISI
jgi:two-component system LytT family response regulator